MTLPVPYPADTRAKGWRFELDYEKIEQSDTWGLAAETPLARPCLLMMWLVAWSQEPCGSLPNDEAIIRARCGIPAATWPKVRGLLMRGWWLAEDGRLYHDTLALRVREMLEYRRKEAERRNRNRGKPVDVPRDTDGTEAGYTPEATVTPDTGTGTGTGTFSPSLRSGEAPAPGDACKAMKSAGLAGVSPSHPKLLALLEAGITLAELVDAAADAAKKGKPFAYALATAEGRRRDAAVAPLPDGSKAVDPDSRSAIEAEGVAKGIGPWNEIAEQWHVYKARVRGARSAPGLDINTLASMAAQRAGVH